MIDMKHFKRFLRALLALIMIPGIVMQVPVTTYATGSQYLSYTVNSDGTEYSVTGCSADAAGKVIIPDIYEGLPVTGIGSSAFSGRTGVTEVVIPEGVTTINSKAFYNCSGIRQLTIPSTVTTIGSSAFYNTAILSVYIKDLAKWCGITFGNQSSNPTYYVGTLIVNDEAIIDELVIPDGVTAIKNYAFCSVDAASVTIPESVTTIGMQAFYENMTLTSIVIPEGITSIGASAFAYCEALTDITMPSTLKSIGDNAFNYCKSLKNVYISDIAKWCEITFSGSTGAYLFYYASNLYLNGVLQENIVIPESVKSIGKYAFYNYKGLKKLTVSEGVEAVGQCAFQNCKNLVEVNLPGSLTKIDSWAFSSCSSIEKLSVPDIVKWCSITFGNQSANPLSQATEFYVNGEFTENLVIPEGVEKINSYAFYYFDQLKKLYLPESLTTIGGWAFDGCTPEGVYISDLSKWCNISMGIGFDIGDLYVDNVLIESLVIPEDVTAVKDYVFSGCTSIKSISFSDSVTKIGKSAFSYCDNISAVIIPDTVTTIGVNAFQYCSSLEKAEVGSGVATIPSYCFSNCDKLSVVCIGENVTSIKSDSFYKSPGIKEIHIKDLEKWCNLQKNSDITADLYINGDLVEDLVIPESITTIKQYAFSGFTSIKSVTIPEGTTKINNYAFRNCKNVIVVNIPESVVTINAYSFYGCNALQEVFYSGSQEQWSAVTISSNAIPSTAYIHYQVTDTENHWEIIGSPTEPHCTEEKTQTYGCSCGNEKTVTISAIGHSYNDGNVTLKPTCETAGQMTFSCTRCGDAYAKEIDALGHNYVWEYDTENLTKFGTCSACGEITGAEKMTATDVITFTLNSDGTEYIVADCLSNYAGDMVIPETYNDLPVTAIGTDAFRDCTRITSVVIPDSIISVGGSAFRNCTGLTEIKFPDNVTTIPGAVCFGCTNLESVVVSDSIISVGGYAFSGCTALKYVFYSSDEANWNKITIGLSNTPLTDSSIHFNSTDHTCSEDWITDLYPTCTENGSKHKECTVCGKVMETETILAGHSYVDGVCTVCGLIDLSPYQSKHPYSNNTEEQWTVYKEGAKFIAVTFSESTETEESFDYIDILNGEDEIVGSYSGTELAGKRIVVFGEIISIRLTSDLSNTYYGFALDNIEVYYEDCAHREQEKVNCSEPTCIREGYTGDVVCKLCSEIIIRGETIPEDEDAHAIQGEHYEPTCVDGYDLYYCIYCNYSYKENIVPATQEHNYIGGFCDLCDKMDPDFVLPEIGIGETKEITIANGGDCSYLSFTPATDGRYNFSSQCGYDTYAYLYDNDMNIIARNDDDEDSENFCISLFLEGGRTYILKSRLYSSTQIGSFDVVCGYDYYFAEGVRLEVSEENNGVYLFVSAKGCDDSSDIITISPDVQYEFVESHIANEKKYYGTGAYLIIDDTYYDFYMVIANGDINGDSVCDVLDVSMLERVISGNDYLEYTEQLYAATGTSDLDDIDEASMPILYQNVVNTALAS